MREGPHELFLASAYSLTPDNDPSAYEVDKSKQWTVTASAPNFIIPNAVPSEIKPYAANNNVAITYFEGRLFLAFRT